MKLKISISIFVLLFSTLTFADSKEKSYTTTHLEMTIQSSSDSAPSVSNMILVDGKPANLVYYDQSGTPESRLEIKSQKLKPKNNKNIIDLNIKFFEFKNGTWKLSQDSSITNYENDLGEVSISSGVERWKLSVLATVGEALSNDELSIKYRPDCNLISSYKETDMGLQSNSHIDSRMECCSSACGDGSDRIMKCCGAIRCCGCGSCCSPGGSILF